MPTYIVESYGVNSIVPDQRERAELAADLGTGIRYIRTTILPGDQTLLHLFEATSSDALREAVSVAALECDRIVEVYEAWAERRDGDPLDGRGGPPRDE
jgi:hypothetical protein